MTHQSRAGPYASDRHRQSHRPPASQAASTSAFAHASTYASNFLASSFAPFGGQQRTSRAEGDHAPLFFSTIDGEAVLDPDDEDGLQGVIPQEKQSGLWGYGHPYSYYGQQGRSAYGRGIHEEEEDEEGEDSHHGLGRPETADNTDDDDADDAESNSTNDPFKVTATRTSVAKPGKTQLAKGATPLDFPSSRHAADGRGWKMHQTHFLPAIKQSFINDFFRQSTAGSPPANEDSSQMRQAEEVDNGTGGSEEDVEQDPPDFLAREDKGKGRDRTSDRDRRDTEQRKAAYLTVDRGPSPPDSKGQETGYFGSERDYAAESSRLSRMKRRRIHRFPLSPARYQRMLESTPKQQRPGVAALSVSLAEDSSASQRYRDSTWLAFYLSNVGLTLLLGLYFLLFDNSKHLPGVPAHSVILSPAVSLLHSISFISLAVLAVLTSLLGAGAYIAIARSGALRVVIRTMLVLPPGVFLFASGWAFVSSYAAIATTSLDSQESGASISLLLLRYLSLPIFLVSLLSTRYAYTRATSSSMERTILLLVTSSKILFEHPHLLLLLVGSIVALVVLAVPTILLLSKLLIHGHWQKLSAIGESVKDGQTPAYTILPAEWATFLALHTVWTYLWTAELLRAVVKHTTAGVVGAWYFPAGASKGSSRPDPEGFHEVADPLMDADNADVSDPLAQSMMRLASQRRVLSIVVSAFHRAVGPSLGTLVLFSLLSSLFSLLSILLMLFSALTRHLQRFLSSAHAPSPFTAPLFLALRATLSLAALLVGVLEAAARFWSDFGIAYAGMTGEEGGTCIARMKDMLSRSRGNGTDPVAARLILSTLLSLLTYSISTLFFLVGYLHATPPNTTAPGLFSPFLIGFSTSLLPAYSIRLAGDLLQAVQDAVFVAWNFELQLGRRSGRSEEIWKVMEWEGDEGSEEETDDTEEEDLYS